MAARSFEGDAFSATGQAPIDFDVKKAVLSGPDGARRLVVNLKDHGDDVVIEAAERDPGNFVDTWRYVKETVTSEIDLDLYNRGGDEFALVGTYKSKQHGPGFWALRLHAVEAE